MTFTAGLTALAASLVLGGICRGVGRRLGILDRPDGEGLKTHATPAVPLGGLGVLVGLHAGLTVAEMFDPGLLLASLLVWAIGLMDDLRGLSPWTRLLGATAAGVLLVVYGPLPSGLVAGVMALLVVLLSINAVNLLDGLDALAGSVAATALVGLAILAGTEIGFDYSGVLIAAAAVLGFLFWNLPPARLFLGNNGAYLVGIILAWAALRHQDDWWAALVAVAAIGVPFMDLGITILRRLRSGAALFGGDRDHTYDRLHQQGWLPGRIAIFFSIVQAVWSTLLITMSIVFGDATTAVIAVTIGLVVVLLGLRGVPRFQRA